MTILRHILLVAIIATVITWAVGIKKGAVVLTPYFEAWVTASHVDFCWGVARHEEQLGVLRGKGKHIIFVHTFRVGSVWPEFKKSSFAIPFWLILAILLPPWWLIGRKSRRRKRWAKEGCCMSCGYNLQGSESGTCSECGAGYGHQVD